MFDEKVIKEFLKLNPKIKEEELLWRADGRLEWLCKHDIRHTVYAPKGDYPAYTCDSCCKGIKKYEPEEMNEADMWAEDYIRYC